MKNARSTFLLSLLLLLGGCAEFLDREQPADASTQPVYSFGQLRYTEITPFERAWAGVHLALKELKYNVKSSEHDLLQAKVIALSPQKEIKIELEETSPTTTEIRIRAGKLGDKVLANEILSAIRKHI